MKNLKIESKTDAYFSPEVEFNAITGKCLIAGESYLEFASELYEKLLEWIKEFFKNNPDKTIDLSIRLSYINTSSSRALLEFFMGLKKLREDGKEINITWYHPQTDYDDMLIEGEEFSRESGLKFKFIEKDPRTDQSLNEPST
jgi:hypothetical protein